MRWSTEKARQLYRIENWSEGYFDVNEQGRLVCCATPLAADTGIEKPRAEIDLYALTHQLRGAGLHLPVLVRFGHILKDRVHRLYEAFNEAINQHDYQGSYTAVYPIKVNQQASVVKHLLSAPAGRVGLEAGSKPELMACIAVADEGRALTSVDEPRVIICNGYKDSEYVRLALMAQMLGHCVYLVIEKPSELELVVAQARQFGIEPRLGVRVRLSSIGEGNWQNSGGEKSKFGLSATAILELVTRLNELGWLPHLKLLHFHMGSQIANLEDFDQGVQEAMRFMIELTRRGADFECLDVGGGLAVDYDGTTSKSYFSMNYGLREYAATLIKKIKALCVKESLREPNIITEAGRAMTAHHGVLITEVIDHETKPELVESVDLAQDSSLHRAFKQTLDELTEVNAIEQLRRADELMRDVLNAFAIGQFSLEQRARAEHLYYQICRRVFALLSLNPRNEREAFQHLSVILADNYFCNFSIFQSTPDVWGIDQVFPIVPLHRLDVAPTRRGLVKDLTCDSDGRIDEYVDGEGIGCTLALPDYRPGEELVLGIFLVGAYQEILGDMHNLFGDTHSVDVQLLPNGEYEFTNIERGDTVTNVLDIVHYNADRMIESYDRQINRAALNRELKETVRMQFLASLRSYTYLKAKPQDVVGDVKTDSTLTDVA